jgi:hypothetical protein
VKKIPRMGMVRFEFGAAIRRTIWPMQFLSLAMNA